jgi:hypothetical protein
MLGAVTIFDWLLCASPKEIVGGGFMFIWCEWNIPQLWPGERSIIHSCDINCWKKRKAHSCQKRLQSASANLDWADISLTSSSCKIRSLLFHSQVLQCKLVTHYVTVPAGPLARITLISTKSQNLRNITEQSFHILIKPSKLRQNQVGVEIYACAELCLVSMIPFVCQFQKTLISLLQLSCWELVLICEDVIEPLRRMCLQVSRFNNCVDVYLN